MSSITSVAPNNNHIALCLKYITQMVLKLVDILFVKNSHIARFHQSNMRIPLVCRVKRQSHPTYWNHPKYSRSNAVKSEIEKVLLMILSVKNYWENFEATISERIFHDEVWRQSKLVQELRSGGETLRPLCLSWHGQHLTQDREINFLPIFTNPMRGWGVISLIY